MILSKVPFHGQMHVMEFGAGNGLICSHVAQIVKKITAVDISQAMLDKLKAKVIATFLQKHQENSFEWTLSVG